MFVLFLGLRELVGVCFLCIVQCGSITSFSYQATKNTEVNLIGLQVLFSTHDDGVCSIPMVC